MEAYVDNYYSFECIGSDCRRNCCQGWKINLDQNTVCYYRSVDDEYMRNICSYISKDEKENDVFELHPGKICPAQDENHLCEIYKRYGEEHMSEVCKSFPRVDVLGRLGLDVSYLRLSTNCEEVLKELYYRKKNLQIAVKYGKNEQKEIEENYAVYEMIQYTGWGSMYIQDENSPLFIAVPTVVRVGEEFRRSMICDDDKDLSDILDDAVIISEEIADAVSETDKMQPKIGWDVIAAIVNAFFDGVSQADIPYAYEMLPDKDGIDIRRNCSGDCIKRIYSDFSNGKNDEWRTFIRRFCADTFCWYTFYLLKSDYKRELLHEMIILQILSVVVPAFWRGIEDTNEYLSRLSILQRVLSNSIISDVMCPAITEQLNPDENMYALMLSKLFE